MAQTPSDAELNGALRAGAERLGQPLDAAGADRLVHYLRLLEKWNRAYNLTAVRAPREMVSRHVLDSLAVRPYLAGRRCIDVGSGAGLPGIPLAVAEPERNFELLEASGKKAQFLATACDELALGNVRIQHSRAEDYRPLRGFDTVISRAVAPAGRLLAMAGHLCAAGGRLLLMKAAVDPAELDRLPQGWRVEGVHRLAVPCLDAQRNVVVLGRPAATGVESTDAAQEPSHRSR